MTPFAQIRATAEYDSRHYAFTRVRTDGLPLERSGPAIEPKWKSWLGGALLFVAIGIVLVVT